MGAQRADQRQPIHLRQHAVDDGDVITAFLGKIVARHPVCCVVD